MAKYPSDPQALSSTQKLHGMSFLPSVAVPVTFTFWELTATNFTKVLNTFTGRLSVNFD